MEKSMKRVEKLVHATNSALAQMKFSLMFDDGLVVGEKSFGRAEAFDGDELKKCQHEFASEANEMLRKMEKMFGSTDANRKNWKALDRIKEINRRMNVVRQEPAEMGQSREKFLSLISEEKLSPCKTSSKGSVRLKPPPPLRGETEPPDTHHRSPTRAHSLLPGTHSPAAKEELKSNILETREIVARGFHTARHLVQKVDNMTKNERKEKTPRSVKNMNEMSVRSLDGRSESNETVRTTKCGRDSRQGKVKEKEKEEEEEKKKKKKKEKEKEKEKEEEKSSGDSVREERQHNARVVDVKGKEYGRSRRRNLRVQRLPSVHIRGGLQLQNVHSLEIPGSGNGVCRRANTGIQILSHEQIERAKMDKAMEEMRREHWCSEEVGNAAGNFVECSNCGKTMRIQKTHSDPRRVDEILRKCNFNVFDPRIDEFVEKCGVIDTGKWCEKVETVGSPDGVAEAEDGVNVGEKKVRRKAGEESKTERRFSLEDLSNRLSSKYREEADALEGQHLRLESLLKSLFRKIDESREVFEECRLFREGKEECGKVWLTATEPVVVSLMGSYEDSERKEEKSDEKDRSVRNSRTEVKVSEGKEDTRMIPVVDIVRRKRNWRRRRRKENEERVMPRFRSGSNVGERAGGRKEAAEEKWKEQFQTSTSSGRNRSPGRSGGTSGKATAVSVRGKMSPGGKSDSVGRSEVMEEGKTAGVGSTASSSSFSEKRELREDPVGGDESPEVSFEREETVTGQEEVASGQEGKTPSEASTEKSENNYESDFESTTNEPEEGGGEQCGDAAPPEITPSGNKLSTISEVDSELERKLSDERRTQRGSDALLDESRTYGEDVTWKHQPALASDISKKSAKAEDTTPEAAETSLKSTPTELVTSLKGILSALKDQFARTETLAEKLTENMRQDKSERAVVLSRVCSPSEDDMPSPPWKMPMDRLVENLRDARKDPTGYAQSADSLSDEGGSSLGEVVVAGRRKCDSSSEQSDSRLPRLAGSRKSSRVSSARREAKNKLGTNGDEAFFSEGEIPSNLNSECCSSHSVGEVCN